MKKNDLIKMLQGIQGNPDIKLWNGYVGDWQDIERVSPHDLVKQTYEDWIDRLKQERIRANKDMSYEIPDDELPELKALYRTWEWEFNAYVTKEDVKEGRYKRKTVWLMQAKPRGKATFDRNGNVDY